MRPCLGQLGPTDPQELEAFLAGLLPALMETHHVPGAVFVMVKDGEVFFQRGYVCALDAVFVIGLAWRLTTVDLFDLFVEVPAEIVLLLVLPLVSIPLTLSLPWWGRRAFAPGRPAPLARLHWWVLTGTAWLLLPVAWYWNLIGFHT